EAMVLIESRVFGGNDSVLEINRDLLQRHEFIPFVIGGAVNPRLKAALHMHGSGGWLDPSGCYQQQDGERPERRHSDEERSQKESQSGLPAGWGRTRDVQ